MVERFNRTLKTRMWTYFSATNSRQFLKVLPELVDSYNHSLHRTIGMKPIDVTKDLETELFAKVYGRVLAVAPIKHKITKGDSVRISKMKTIFEKGYIPNWSGEVFKVTEHAQRPKRVYKLQDMAGEDIAGIFYKEEVQPISYDPGKQVPVEKILKTKTILGKKEYLVKWLHLPNKFNSWVKEKDLNRI